MEWMKKIEMKESEVDEPAVIIAGVVEQRRRLLSGIGGAADVNRGLWKEAFERFPSHWAISLSGEPTIYPKLPELIGALRTNPEVKSVFLVTNGQEPEMLEKLDKEKVLPTQLYISVDAPDAEMFAKVNRSLYKDGWERLNRSLEMMSKLGGKCNRVIRFTLIKGLNDDEGQLARYAELFRKSGADFIEIKAYMFLGHSRKRLKQENMPDHEYVVEWSRKLAAHLPDYEKKNEDTASRIVLFSKAV
jgi:tRNA wybutosine-synthesizing protein 1